MRSIISSGIYCVIGIVMASCSSDDEIDPQVQLGLDIDKIEAYILDNDLQNVETTSTGLHYLITSPGNGSDITSGEIVVVHYEGKLLDGTVFDSSMDRDPFTYQFGIGSVIPGFDEGVFRIGEEGIGTIIVPSYLAYGTRGSGTIGPNEVLVFDLEVLGDDQIRDIDLEKIGNYIQTNSITDIQETASGLNYTITQEGMGNNAINGNEIAVFYKGYLLDGTVFDETTTNTFDYTIGNTNLIDGWEEAILLLNKGAKGIFFLPSTLAYGRSGQSTIAPNTPLIFELELVDIK